MTRSVPYIKKVTQANTEYRKSTSADTNWILAHCKRLVSVANDCANAGIKEGAALNAPNPKMPRMSTGQHNTPKSMCEGVVDNFTRGQYDLSNKQCDGLVEAFRIGNDIIEDFEEVEFNEVAVLPKLVSVIEMNNIDNTVFSDIFDLSQYEVDTITLRKRK